MKLSLLVLYFSKICLAHSAPLVHDGLQAANNNNSSRPAVTTAAAVSLRDTLLYKKISEALKARELASAPPPRGYIDLRENERRGPEGKIALPLIGSINADTMSDGESNSGSKFAGGDGAAAGILVFNRALPLTPAAGPRGVRDNRDDDDRRYAACFLLAAITIAAILLLYAVRNLMNGRDLDTSVAPPYRKISALGTGEKILFVCLVAVLFACLTALLSKTFFDRYYRERREQPIGGGSTDLTYSLTSSSNTDCLRRLIQKSGRVFCIVKDGLGRELVVRKLGGEEARPFLSEKFDLWRSIFAAGASDNSEKLRVNQLRLLESGILNKWYPRQTISANLEEYQEESNRGNEPKEIRKFVHFIALIVLSGCLVAFVMFLAEHLVRIIKMRNRSLQYVYLDQ